MCCQNAAEFDEQVDRWTLTALGDHRISFAQLVYALPSVYPSAVRASLVRLAAIGAVDRNLVDQILIGTTTSPRLREISVNSAASPVPHPLDFEWRYAGAAIDRLLHKWDEVAGPLVLLGTPSVAASAVTRCPSKRVIVFDANAAALSHLRCNYPSVETKLCDLVRDELPAVIPGAQVVIDPPWYPEFFEAFFWAACRISLPGATVLVSLPPLGTRPGIREERARIFSSAARMGLEIDHLDRGVLPYVTPHFEQNALQAEAIIGVPLDWRRGDLVKFVRNGSDPGPRPLPLSPFERWREIAVSGVRIRIRDRAAPGFDDPCLIPLVQGDILPTVSRRDPRRAKVDVWTSGNRVFACHSPTIFAHVLRALLLGESPLALVASALGRAVARREAVLVHHASEQAENLVQTEQREQLSWDEQCRHEGLTTSLV